ncbi:Calx-beta domain-containing protein [Beggiatoa alba B18LD]|uniref:Calx-beta domain-containing protein n=1 Tax=Beggiatoa alba B18LD TaxID=395493 RepID=I3CBK3_9GAMM|nr:Calx-beta domain-containing protein [Beggiatoa alba]EIJ40996.1 Calx-beta domain-containing protein [Beggiatoa alba B18LD]
MRQIQQLLLITGLWLGMFSLAYAQASLQFASAAYAVNEADGTLQIVVTRAADSVGAVTVDYATIDTTALSGVDYTGKGGTLTWADGDLTHRVIEITILTDSTTENNESFAVILANPSGNAVLGTNLQTAITIVDTPVNGAGNLQFTSTTYTAKENAGIAQLGVERIGGSVGNVAVQYAITGGTAVANTDYVNVQGTLNWNTGDAQDKNIAIPLLLDDQQDGDKTLVLSLSTATGGATVGANNTTTLTIQDVFGTVVTSSAGVLTFKTALSTVNENAGVANVEVSRLDGTQGSVTVSYSTINGTAIAGSDYTLTQGALSWANGENNTKTISVPILTDNNTEDDEIFAISLSNPTGNAVLGMIASTNLKILDGTGNPTTVVIGDAGAVQFESGSYTVDENQGNLNINVLRVSGTKGDVRVNYTIQNGTATNGQDFVLSAGTLVWADGNSDVKTLNITLQDDITAEENENFIIQLSNPSNGLVLGTPAAANVTIRDNDATRVQFSSSDYLVNESGRYVNVTVTRQGSSQGRITVNYQTNANTAIDNKDYIGISGLIVWEDGDASSKVLSIPINNDTTIEETETFRITLSNLTGNGTLGSPAQAVITIKDDDAIVICSDPPPSVINCYLDNTGNTLTNVRITNTGIVFGGQLAGKIDNFGSLENVTLLTNATLNNYEVGVVTNLYLNNYTNVTGGFIQGSTIGIGEYPATLTSVRILTDSYVQNVIIEGNTIIDTEVSMGNQVRFRLNGNIPPIDLSNLLGYTPSMVLGRFAINLYTDVLVNSVRGGVLSALNGLYDLTEKDWLITQDSESGYIAFTSDNKRYNLLPTRVRQALEGQIINDIDLGLIIREDNRFLVTTHTGREVTAHPVIQDTTGLEQVLNTLVLPVSSMQMNDEGNVKLNLVNQINGITYFSIRADICSSPTSRSTSPELGFDTLPISANLYCLSTDENMNVSVKNALVAYLVFNNGQSRQYLYPAAADAAALRALSQDTLLYKNGMALIHMGEGASRKTYKGWLTYAITQGTNLNGHVEIFDVDDMNQDGLSDYLIVYPNGDGQLMYRVN